MAQSIAIGVTAGGTAIREPSSIVTGSGLTPYVIPPGFLGVVTVTQDIYDFTVDGTPIVLAGGTFVDLTGEVVSSAHSFNPTPFTSNFPGTMIVSGSFTLSVNDVGFQQAGDLRVNEVVFHTMTGHPSASTQTHQFTDMPLTFGGTIRGNGITTWTNPPAGPGTYSTSGTGIGEGPSSVSVKLNLKQGTSIAGGKYTVELYSI